MLTGYNTDFKFDGKIYHCQTEDGGVNSPFVTSLMYHQGAILARRKTSYADILKADCLEDVVRELMMEQHKGMIRDLMQNKLQVNVNAPHHEEPVLKAKAPVPPAPAPEVKRVPPPSPKPEEVKEKSLDDIILEFLEQDDKGKNK